MKYIDRKGNITIEEKEPDKLLRYFYADRGGRLCLEILVRSFIFGFGERLFDSPLSRKRIPGSTAQRSRKRAITPLTASWPGS